MCCLIIALIFLLIALYFCSIKKYEKYVSISAVVFELLLFILAFIDKNKINCVIWFTIFFIFAIVLINHFLYKNNIIEDISKIIIILISFIVITSLVLCIVDILASKDFFAENKLDKFEKYSATMTIVTFFVFWIIKIVIELIKIALHRIKSKIFCESNNMYYKLVFNDKIIIKSLKIGYIMFLLTFYLAFALISGFISIDGSVINNNVLYILLNYKIEVPKDSNLTNAIVLTFVFNLELLLVGLESHFDIKSKKEDINN